MGTYYRLYTYPNAEKESPPVIDWYGFLPRIEAESDDEAIVRAQAIIDRSPKYALVHRWLLYEEQDDGGMALVYETITDRPATIYCGFCGLSHWEPPCEPRPAREKKERGGK